MDEADQIASHLKNCSELLLETSSRFHTELIGIAKRLESVFDHGNKLLLCGNGGSCADAEHVAAEFVVRYKRDREPLPAFALATSLPLATASGNDLGFERLFSRQVRALGQSGDLLWAFTTSGRSANVLAALTEARTLGLYTVVFTGAGGASLKSEVDHCVAVPSTDTAHIQEVHQAAAHAICQWIDSWAVRRSL